MIRLAQLSDLHLVGEAGGLIHGKDTSQTLGAVIEAFPVRADVTVVTGDIAHDGSPRACELAASMTSTLGGEVHYIAGNHDDRSVMDQVLDSGDDLRMVELSSDWALALVCSQWTDHDAGKIDEGTLARLEEALAVASGHVVVCVHHPPSSTCSNSDCSLTNGSDLMNVLRGSQCVRAVLSGHLHRAFDASDDGMHLLGAPSTFEQLEHGGEPHFRPSDAPPGARLIELHDDGDVTSRLVVA